MSRAVRSVVWSVGLALSVAGAGCAHMIENRAITTFAKNLEAQNLEGLKVASSDDFNKRALRTATALEDIKILRIPDGKTSIMNVEKVSETKKRVTVQVGEDKKEVFYELTLDDSGKWVIDDIYLKQKKKGIEAYKSVTEQMDLLLTVREFLDAWNHGDREQVLSVATPKLRTALEELPPPFLAQVTRQVTSNKPASGKFRPSASMDEKLAVVRLPRKSGETVLSMELRKGKWQVADIAILCKDEEEKLPSVLNLAHAVNRCVGFLAAYQADDKTRLETLCENDFFQGSLSFADLSQARLPDPHLPEHELQVRLRGNRADFTLRSEAEFIQIDMQREPDITSDALPAYVVSDVTIYEVDTKQEKRLSALFTAQGMLEVFVDALSHRKLDQIKHCSTRDFSSRVWDKMSEATVPSMPLEGFDSPEVEYVSATFQGALTKIEVRQGGRPYTYLLRDERGKFLVDDVQWQVTGVPASVKSTLEILIPIQDFAAGITLGRNAEQQEQALDLIRGNCTNDFNRMVWSQSDFVPNSGMSADTFLQAPVKSMAFGDKEVVVNFGDQKYGAKVTLRHEYDRYIVDDIMLIAGPEESQRLALRQTLRTQLANGKARGPQTVVQASFSPKEDPQVERAVHQTSEETDDISPAAVNPPRELEPEDAEPLDPFADEFQQEP
ncbi:hypothetical protein [Schlesneria sp. T3-172]|uniref:hypothetical protein n=1 Tax=Schlesneria TaxID=656899 RepID=UPI002F1D71C1